MAVKPTVSISELNFSGGDSFQLKENEKIILVGPNNSGKSQSLREIFSICQDGKTDRTLVVKGLKISKKGDQEDLQRFLDENAEYILTNYRYKNWNIPENHIRFWSQPYLMHGLINGFIKNIDANNRLNICNKQNSISPGEQKSVPQHILYDDEVLMAKISDLFRQAFGKDLMFDFRGGSNFPFMSARYQMLKAWLIE